MILLTHNLFHNIVYLRICKVVLELLTWLYYSWVLLNYLFLYKEKQESGHDNAPMLRVTRLIGYDHFPVSSLCE